MTFWEKKLTKDHVEVLTNRERDLNDSLKKHAKSESENMVFDGQTRLIRWSYGVGLRGCIRYSLDLVHIPSGCMRLLGILRFWPAS